MSLHDYMQSVGLEAKRAARSIANASTAQKNQALMQMAEAIKIAAPDILAANRADLLAAKQNNYAPAFVDRLTLSQKSIDGIVRGLALTSALPDPVGELSASTRQPSGLMIGKMRVPLGVIGIIYESRPNVTIDAASLCLKSGNASILRGGSEAQNSNQAFAQCIADALKAAELPAGVVQVINTTDRAAVGELITMNEFVDVIIPRGGKNLVQRIASQATVSVIKHLDGNCHVYIDEFADLDKAVRVAYDAKTYRYGVCGSMETLLIHRHRAADVLAKLVPLYIAKGVELRGDASTCALVPSAIPATEADWGTEFLAPILAIKIVDSLDQAIDHIETYGSHHTDSIVTDSLSHANRFLREVDSASVMVNTPTVFADGFEYGLGAEIGISTNKLHARGPVGLEGLTTQKYIVLGDGQVRG